MHHNHLINKSNQTYHESKSHTVQARDWINCREIQVSVRAHMTGQLTLFFPAFSSPLSSLCIKKGGRRRSHRRRPGLRNMAPPDQDSGESSGRRTPGYLAGFSVHISVDLVPAARRCLSFLARIAASPWLHHLPTLRKSVQRFIILFVSFFDVVSARWSLWMIQQKKSEKEDL